MGLMDALLAFDPAGRIGAAEALKHPYFSRGVPAATAAELLAKVRTGSSVKEEDIKAAAAGAAAGAEAPAAPAAPVPPTIGRAAPPEPEAAPDAATAGAAVAGVAREGEKKKRVVSGRPPLAGRPGGMKKRRLDFS